MIALRDSLFETSFANSIDSQNNRCHTNGDGVPYSQMAERSSSGSVRISYRLLEALAVHRGEVTS